ncbi:MAG: universal stress protein [Acidimicrobiales bacterium]
MYSTIVVDTDGSRDAEQALRAAAELAGLSANPEVHVVTAYRPLSTTELERIAHQVPEDVRPLLHAHVGAEGIITDARTIFQVAAIEAEFHEVDDDPTDALLTTAERVRADLIVVGSRGEGLAKRALHGSVSTKVLHNAPCAVLVVKSDR